MRLFMDQDFLLQTDTAKELYHECAAKLPIIDYHCHVNPREIAQNQKFQNLTQLWLKEDHYKWRLMRMSGVEERYITGKASDWEKFEKWVETLERSVGNPLYHWCHLELQRYFGYYGVLNTENRKEVWDFCSQKLSRGEIGARELIKQSRVVLICTTDDPTDSLRWHRELREDTQFVTQVLPTWRPDRLLEIEKDDFLQYIEKLEQLSEVKIQSVADLKSAAEKRMDYFQEFGCKLADHGMENIYCVRQSREEVEAVLKKRLRGESIAEEEIMKYKMELLSFFASQYQKRNWTMQLHLGCHRNSNTREFQRLGADTGFDCINNEVSSKHVIGFLDELNIRGNLPRMLIYCLNSADYEMIGAAVSCFSEPFLSQKVQLGAAWWFHDCKAGIEKQLEVFANLGSLGNFVGMLTDSRSFLSYVRHEYFRRILCNLLGKWVEDGECPRDKRHLNRIVRDICCKNAVRYFGFNLNTI